MRNFLTYLFFALSMFFCVFTYLLLSNVESYSNGSQNVIAVLYVNIIFILIFLLLSSHKIYELWSNRHSKGSRLSFRFVVIFSLLSVIPSVCMSLFSAFFFHSGIESWFNERNRTVLRESMKVAESYLDEHKKNAMNDCLTIAKIMDYHVESMLDIIDVDYEHFSQSMGFQLDDLCALKGINSAILLDSSFNIIAHSKYSTALHFIYINKNEIIDQVNEKNAIILELPDDNTKNINAIACFRTRSNEYIYLIIEKNVNAQIISNAQNARSAYNEYYNLLEKRGSLEIAFIFMFLMVGILLLVASIVIAILYSWKIVKPISNLIDVSASIIDGDDTARAKEVSSDEEMSLLIKTFNKMVQQVQEQKEDLININSKLDERMKFTSSVLAGVSSGVIGIDHNAIYIWNNAAEKLLGKEIVFGEHIGNLIPEIEEMITEAYEKQFLEREVQYKKDGEYLLFSVKIENIDFADSNLSRFVITFDDMTNVVVAQRRIAWAEVARRVAHEIKNPLTPIQLSAERLKRKYISQISTDPQIFSELVNTIIRQVGDIKRLIDDFNFFARLPESLLRLCDVYEICKQAIFLMENTTNSVEITFDHAKESYTTRADERLLHQSIVNLIQNSLNALNTITKADKKICVTLEENNEHIIVSVEDNGPGLPKEKMESLATPYFTLTPKGTGLGLTIVKKIVQDHGGELLFEDSKLGGAKVTLLIPRR
ncbi:MAG: GHKL domain-containing protein [Holosporaceae bacterium]|nr:GHKL domain-containing protein [Holosporaceae bacterium]